MNLYGNSLKYTEKGFIHVALRLQFLSNDVSSLYLTVNDSGVGIGDDFLRHKLFTPFSQENQLIAGTGLGLSVVHRIVRMLGGTINVDSRVNGGTSVTVRLPVYAPKEAARINDEFSKQASALSGLRADLSAVDANPKVTDAIPGPLHLQHISERKLLGTMCHEWLGMELIDPRRTSIKPDLMICSDATFEELSTKAATEATLPPIVVICRNIISAHEYNSSFKPTLQIPVAEFVTRP